MTLRALVASLALLVGLVACTAARPTPQLTFSAPQPTPTATALATPTPGASFALKTVTSERLGWSVEVPVSWRFRPATEDWPSHTYPVAGAPYTDSLEPEDGGFPALDISAQEVAADQTPETFLAWLDVENANRAYTVNENGEIVVDGVTGRLQRQSLGPENIWEVALFKDGWVYLIYWVGRESERAADEPLFTRVMSTFQFPPG